MSRQLVFLAGVSRDVGDGSNYYESLSPGRGGERFEAAFRLALRQIERGLITHGLAFGHFHRVFLRPYPYNLYYRLVEGRAVITAVLYARSDPKKIEGALRVRSGRE
jgi:plasmid stabilization system protein ParE